MRKKSRVLVTGGAGYIGTHTTVELVNAGYEVIVLDNLSNSEQSALEGVEQIIGKKLHFEHVDCNDRKEMDRVFVTYDFDSVIHFAAYKAVGESVQKPLEYYHNNLESLVVLLEMMNKHSVSNLVFSSSCTVYGQPNTLPVTESTPRQVATSPYGNTKQINEDIIRDTAHSDNNLHAISLRYFNPIGAHHTALIGELPKGIPGNLVPFITQTAAGLRECLSIFGDDYNTIDGTAIRDYIDVTDLARAHVAAVNRLCNSKQKQNYEVFNVGTGNGRSVLELVKTFERVNSLKVNYKIVPRREGDIEQIWAETTLANDELSWKATKTIDETLASAWAWEKKLHNIK